MTPQELARTAYDKFRASQRVDELSWVIRRVAATDPAVIVEIGCDAGGTLFVWRQLCDRVYGVTLPANTLESGGQGTGYQLDAHGAEVWLGDSRDPVAWEWLTDQLDGAPIDVLHIDGDHSYGGVRADYETFGPLVRPGGLILFHDVANHLDPRVEVPRFWAELTADRPGEVIAARRPLGFGIWTVQ